MSGRLGCGTAIRTAAKCCRFCVLWQNGKARHAQNGRKFDSLRKGMRSAKAVLVNPEIPKRRIFLGGSGSTGVLLVRGDKNVWCDPAFYTMSTISFGLEFGGQKKSVVIPINSHAAIDSLMVNTVKVGGELSVLEVCALLNKAFCGQEVTPLDIVSKHTVSNWHSVALRKAVAAES